MKKILLVLFSILLLLSCNKKEQEYTDVKTDVKTVKNNNEETEETEKTHNTAPDEKALHYNVENKKSTTIENFLTNNFYNGSTFDYQLDEKGNLYTLGDYTFYKIEDKILSNYLVITEENKVNIIMYIASSLFYRTIGSTQNFHVFTNIKDVNIGLYVFAKTELDSRTTLSILKSRNQTTLKTETALILDSNILIIDKQNKEEFSQSKNTLNVLNSYIRNANSDDNSDEALNYFFDKTIKNRVNYTYSKEIHINSSN